MARYEYDLLVIGGGAAGLTTTAGAAQLGAKVLLVERAPALGGDCLHHGCVPSKTLITSARVYHRMANASRFGLPQPDMNALPVDYTAVADRIRSVITAIQPHDSPERFQRLGAEVAFGDAAFMDAHTVRITDTQGMSRSVSAERIVIATGSSPAVPAIPGLADVPYLTNMQVFTLNTLPESLIILGAGPIAMEMAQAFGRLGSRVTVIQRSGQILSREDKDMADIVQQAVERDGVTILLQRSVTRVQQGNNGSIQVVCGHDMSAGQEQHEEVIEGHALLVALGRSPNVQGLQLEKAGVTYSAKGIPADARMRTNVPHIFACGDITGRYQFTHAAGYEAGIVLSNALFRLPRKADYTWLPWATYTEPELASIGLNEKAARKQGIQYTVRTEAFSGNDRALTEGETKGRLKMLLDGKNKVLGVQIAGPHAGELINEWAAVLGGGVKLSTLASAIHPYPTLGEINKRVAGSLMGEKLFSGTVRTILHLLFRYRGNGPSGTA